MTRPKLRCDFDRQQFVVEWNGRQPEQFGLFYAALGRAVELATEQTDVEIHNKDGFLFTIPVRLTPADVRA